METQLFPAFLLILHDIIARPPCLHSGNVRQWNDEERNYSHVIMIDIANHQPTPSYNLIHRSHRISPAVTRRYEPITSLRSCSLVSEVASPAGFHSLVSPPQVSLSEPNSHGGAAAVLPLAEQPDEPWQHRQEAVWGMKFGSLSFMRGLVRANVTCSRGV